VIDKPSTAELIETHRHVPRKAAAMIYSRVRGHIEFDELVALGQHGLAEAAARYDATRGASFATFAWYRVQGAILDGLRRLTPLPRKAWRKLVALRAAKDYLEHQDASPDRAGALATIDRALRAIRTIYMVSLEACDDVAETPVSIEDRIDAERVSTRVADVLSELPASERELIRKHYWDGKDLREAGAELGISRSWSSRLHARAIDRIRDRLADLQS